MSVAPDDLNLKQSASQRVFAILKDRINSWELPPGHHLRERQLCDEFAISRIPVREALGALENLGLVEKFPNRGCYVKQPHIDDINNIYDMRVALESFIVRKLAATGGLDAAVHHRLWSSWASLQNGGHPLTDSEEDLATLTSLDIEFHLTLAQSLDNPYILRAIRDIEDRLVIVRKLDISDTRRIGDTCRDHLAILAAIQAADPDAAAHHLARNINGAREKVESSIMQALVGAHRRQGR
jgi:DNA-binding GntR family transcriptional regulator